MKIDSPNSEKIIVELSDEDMSKLDITYDELDYSNIETRRVIWTILAKARKFLGRDIDPSSKMMIETLPAKSGGCMILFTVPSKNNEKSNALPLRFCQENLVYEFKNIDDIIDLYKNIKSSNDTECFQAQLFFDGKSKYRLIVEKMPDIPCLKKRLNEYAMLCQSNDVMVAFTKEHWQKISSNIFC
ncbi:MAG: adaptor protein MecA [Clostridia bacterium]|nr:adaptor protein MecA [Clostridia bacterium]